MDHIKDVIANAVTQAVNSDDFVNSLFEIEGIETVEVHDVSPLENQIRVTGAGMPGMPRYFLVKVSEQQ